MKRPGKLAFPSDVGIIQQLPLGRVWWLRPVISATWEAQIRVILV
jgi:hypothetical protein